jgi:hypothetical protein
MKGRQWSTTRQWIWHGAAAAAGKTSRRSFGAGRFVSTSENVGRRRPEQVPAAAAAAAATTTTAAAAAAAAAATRTSEAKILQGLVMSYSKEKRYGFVKDTASGRQFFFSRIQNP